MTMVLRRKMALKSKHGSIAIIHSIQEKRVRKFLVKDKNGRRWLSEGDIEELVGLIPKKKGRYKDRKSNIEFKVLRIKVSISKVMVRFYYPSSGLIGSWLTLGQVKESKCYLESRRTRWGTLKIDKSKPILEQGHHTKKETEE